MKTWRRAVGAGAVCVLVAAMASIVMGVGPASATTVSANDDLTFRNAFLDTTTPVTQIDLSADISMNCAKGTYSRFGDGAVNDVVINGHGHTITAAPCPGKQVLLNGGSASLTLNDVVVTGGSYLSSLSIAGGGIQSNGDVLLNRSAVIGNSVENFSDIINAHSSGGGIVVVDGKTLTLNQSSVVGNRAICNAGGCTNNSASGGGIFADVVVLVNSTVTGNSSESTVSDTLGGGILAKSVTAVYSTIAGNSASVGANLWLTTGGSSFASVVALPAGGGENCAHSTLTSNGYNWDDDGSCGFGGGTGDHADAGDPKLAATSSSGILPVRPPLVGSPLLAAIVASNCSNDGASAINPLVDQLGTSRPGSSGCTIGAIEVPMTSPPPDEGGGGATPIAVTPNFTG